MSNHNDNFDYDEGSEDFQDPFGDADKDESMPPLQQEETGPQRVHKRAKVPKSTVQIHKQPFAAEPGTTRRIEDDKALKYDTLRKKYDLRNQEVDLKSINNIWLRARIKDLKERSQLNTSEPP